jgi:hypothetical protein
MFAIRGGQLLSISQWQIFVLVRMWWHQQLQAAAQLELTGSGCWGCFRLSMGGGLMEGKTSR